MWLKIDDGFHCHRKVRKAARACPSSLGLWLVTGSACADAATEGLVSIDMLADCLHDAGLAGVAGTRAVGALVAAEMWHDSKTIRRCDRCLLAAGRLPKGCFYFHDWLDFQYTRDEAKVPEVRWKKARSKALHRDHLLKQRILDRDLDRCRYCAVRVDFRDRVGPTGGTYDHVDPSIRENTYENVVVACKGCNTEKADRTPLEAGMILLDPPGPDLPPVGSEHGDGPSPTRAGARGRDGSGREQAPVRSEPAHEENRHG